MMRTKLALLAIFLFATTTGAASQNRVIGLLPLHVVFGDSLCYVSQPFEREVPLYPEAESEQVIGNLHIEQSTVRVPGCEGLQPNISVYMKQDQKAGELLMKEYGYEVLAAIVLEKHGNWFKVLLSDGAAWLKASTEDEYYQLESLLMNGLAYFANAPGTSLLDYPRAVEIHDDNRTPSIGDEVRVRGFQKFEGELWLHVEVMSHSICEPGEEPTVLMEGWMPAHTPLNEPTIWFYSRGC